ncbi:pullulanase-type alpha-1,6-glucosidase [Gilvimarinus japonicus]|uniref:Pullulanase-type alpha-1,6-glucosidase n=1 Tax=Gilvimarinus japonicus TaxID=1796469 RepID=A0ABV7HWE4_9GAMM
MRRLTLSCLLSSAALVACGGGDSDTPPIASSSSSSSSVASSSSESSSSSSAPSFALPVALKDDQAIVFYERNDAEYDGWGLHLWNNETCGALDDAATGAITWDAPFPATGIDDTYGAYYLLDLNAPVSDGGCVNFIVHKGDDKALGDADAKFDLSRGAIALTQHGAANIEYPLDPSNENPLPFTLTDTQAAIFYKRSDTEYDGWGLHLWNGGDCTALADNSINGVTWDAPKQPDGIDTERGAFFVLDLNQPGGCFNFIVHSGDDKALGDADSVMDLTQGNVAFTQHGSSAITYSGDTGPAQATLSGYAAHWIDSNTLVWDAPNGTAQVQLLSDPNGAISLTNGSLTGGDAVTLTNASISSASATKFPHLADWAAWQIPTNELNIDTALSGELVAAAFDADGQLIKATSVQTQGALDAYYATDATLGAHIVNGKTQFSVWAPTAQTVTLQTFASDSDDTPATELSLTRNDKGVWRGEINRDMHGEYYRYKASVYHYLTDQIESITTTDPYSLNLSQNGELTQVVDLDRADTYSNNWSGHSVPALAAPEDSIIYEVHIRDFSALDASTPADHRGKYLAFTDTNSTPVKHLAELQQAGLNTIHLLPTFDIATVNEDPAARVDITDTVADLCAIKADASVCGVADNSKTLETVLAEFDPTTTDAQALVGELRGIDSFNWGYDPFHYTAPEGSYATSNAGFAHIREFRAMVQALHEMNLRVVMDVVYNHTNSSGLWDKSVLDKLVPGYYHRRNELSGAIETSSCCDNTASEHDMMEKLMIDSLVVWARDYKIDGFRFDLMGHHMRRNIIAARDAVEAVDPDTYFYGEGWNFGEVMSNRRGVNAIQVNMAGTGVGTFNDRIRDAVRGGAPFDGGDSLRANQGYGSGLYYYPNNMNSGAEAEADNLIGLTDRLRVNLAGSLTSYPLTDRNGNTVTGGEVPYFDLNAGYTADPQESINYISKHDNQTLWDNLMYKAASGMSTTERVRMHNFSLSVPMLAQGIPFIHMGVDLLRSKSMERDSYDSGDWFNRVDFTGQSNNWNIGLPREDKDSGNYDVIAQIISDANANPDAADIALANAVFKEWLAIRSSSPLLRLTTAAQVESNLTFHNTGPDQVPGLMVMSLTDNQGLDSQYAAMVVVFNPSNTEQTINNPVNGTLQLHPVQQSSADAITASASVSGNQLKVPALTTAVFVQMD